MKTRLICSLAAATLEAYCGKSPFVATLQLWNQPSHLCIPSQALDMEAGRAVSGQEAVSVQLISPTGAAATVPVELADAGTRFRCGAVAAAAMQSFDSQPS